MRATPVLTSGNLPERVGGTVLLKAENLQEGGANVIDVKHVREGVDLHVRERGVDLVLETRGPDHAKRLIELLGGEGYTAEVLD